MKKKILNILLIVLASLITIALVFIMIYKKNLKYSYKDFVNISEKFCLTPGLDTKFVPQGISYNEKHNLILVVGYNSDKKPSPIFLIEHFSKKIR
jgi:flagellar basal body-associated protein FliL